MLRWSAASMVLHLEASAAPGEPKRKIDGSSRNHAHIIQRMATTPVLEAWHIATTWHPSFLISALRHVLLEQGRPHFQASIQPGKVLKRVSRRSRHAMKHVRGCLLLIGFTMICSCSCVTNPPSRQLAIWMISATHHCRWHSSGTCWMRSTVELARRCLLKVSRGFGPPISDFDACSAGAVTRGAARGGGSEQVRNPQNSSTMKSESRDCPCGQDGEGTEQPKQEAGKLC